MATDATPTPARAPASAKPSFGDLLRRYRRAAGLTQEQLAERAGLSVRGINDLERGARRTPRRDTVELLADALALSDADRAALAAAARPVAPVPAFHPTAGPGSPDASTAASPPGGYLGALPEGPLVAREDELLRTLAALEAVAQGVGHLVLLVGEPGVGKTRLAQEVALAARERDFLVATGRCYEQQTAVAYFPFLEALTHAYAAAPSQVRAELPVRWAEVARLLPEQDTGVAFAARGGQSKDEQQLLFWQVTGFLRALADGRPIALLLDDLHWADEASLDLLQHLARHTREQRILLLGTYRDVEVGRQRPLEAALRDLTREHLVERIPMRRLPLPGTGDIIQATLGEARVSDEFTRLLHGRTDGNPFFIQEVLRALIERGDLYREDGHWERRAIGEIEVPESVRSTIGQRVGRLSPSAQDLLRHASILGQAFSFADLHMMSGKTEETVGAGLDEAAAAGLVRETGGEAYTFSHALIHQTVAEELPGWRRRRLHRAAGEAMERLPEAARRSRAAELAWHFREADEGARALPYALLAGDYAANVYAHAEAEAFYRTAVELAGEAGDTPREAEAFDKLGVMLNLRSRYVEARDPLDRALAAYRALDDAEGIARVLTHLAFLYSWGGMVDEGIARLVPEVEELDRSTLSSRGHAMLALALTELYVATRRQVDLLAAAQRAEDFARAAGDMRLLGEAMGRRGLALLWSARAEDAVPLLHEAARVSEQAGDLLNVARDLNNVVSQYQLWGQLDRCAELGNQALELAERRALPQQIAAFSVNSSDLAFTVGDWSRARHQLERARAVVGQTGGMWFTPYYLSMLGRLDLAQGHEQSGVTALEEAIAHSEQRGDLQALVNAVPWLAERDLVRGDPSAARHRVEPLPGKLEPGEADWAVAQTQLAWASLLQGDEPGAAARLDETVPLLRERMHRFILVDTLRVLAQLRIHQGRWAEAVAALDEALALARAMPYPYAEAKALYVYGQLHATRGEPERARERFAAALAICARLGERLYAEHIEQALSGLDHS